MHLVVVAWLYVALMMAVAEALSSQGTVIGAVFTFLLYGALPVALVVYIGLWPARRRLRLAREQQASAEARDGGGHAAAGTVAPEREEG